MAKSRDSLRFFGLMFDKFIITTSIWFFWSMLWRSGTLPNFYGRMPLNPQKHALSLSLEVRGPW